jgi:16S rRNA (guanine966-N2)-methyltransferase
LRVVSGRFRGRQLAVPPDERTRPTSDRVREALFNILAHGIEGLDIENASVLDLFAGTGALGIEALSRGARLCLFVEDDPDARGLIRTNVEAFGLTGVTRVWRRDATRLGPAGQSDRCDLVFADPPYGKGLGEAALASAAEGGWLVDGAIVVLEERTGIEIAWPSGFELIDSRQWGGTTVHIGRYRAASDPAAARARGKDKP